MTDHVDTKIIQENGAFPNNSKLPLLHYKKTIDRPKTDKIKELFASNGWRNAWVNGIYPFHHFHSNTHEALGIAKGHCDVQIGGEGGPVFHVEDGDVLVIPAGVSHKNVGSSPDFTCVGCYPSDISYNMHKGKENELEEVKRNIYRVPLPDKDPVFGESGPLFDHWKE